MVAPRSAPFSCASQQQGAPRQGATSPRPARLATVAPDVVPRIIYLTGGAFTDRARAFLATGRPFLEKPVDAQTIRQRVADLVKRAVG